MALHGSNFINSEYSKKSGISFQAINPAQQTFLDTHFHCASEDETNWALTCAQRDFLAYSGLSGIQRAEFLEEIAHEIELLGSSLIERALQETGLPQGRLEGERGRTTNQLRQFAQLLREGSWVEASMDLSIPNRIPAPKPDLRKMLIPIGPVVVFGASNFPLAFSVAGGDTASALAAGNPVIVKAHPAHPGTSELVAEAIFKAIQKHQMPAGTFSLLHDSGFKVGQSLVAHPATKAVGFTGSFGGGKALFDIAQSRKDPIPFFAEMGSVNPVILLPGAQKRHPDQWASEYVASLTLGAGQFCTNPGLLIVEKSPDTKTFINTLSHNIRRSIPQTMLTPTIAETFKQKESEVQARTNPLAKSEEESLGNTGKASMATVSGQEFLKHPELAEEVFGPFALLVQCTDREELKKVINLLNGQLTASLLFDESDKVEDLLPILQQKAGRVILNGLPTGVEVCDSMHHGGPFPASTDSRYTSVGTSAIKRFVRPVSFQNFPDQLLPRELQNSNPLDIWRKANGEWTKKKLNP